MGQLHTPTNMNLNNTDEIKQLDQSNMVGSIEVVDKQFSHAWEEASSVELPEDYKDIDAIVFSGTGGSAFGAHVFQHLFAHDLRVPYMMTNGYTLPAWVSDRTLVIVQSYSGNTEEMISGYNEAIKKGAKIMSISAGGQLADLAQEHATPHYMIDPKYNPSGQPRMAFGYGIVGMIAMLNTLGHVSIEPGIQEEINSLIAENNKVYGVNVPTESNVAKQTAEKLHNTVPIFLAAEHLVGAIHCARNQFNENAKTLSVYFPIPGMNHHMIEGLQYPKRDDCKDTYIIVESDLYSDKNALRTKLTGEVIEEQGHTVIRQTAQGSTKLGQVISVLHMNAYIGFYLSMIEGINPSPIPIVEGFKKKLT